VRPGVGFAAAAAAALLVTLFSRPAHAAPHHSGSIHLPLVHHPGPGLGCSPGGGSWEAVCGGFGRVRDLMRLDDGRLIAVGDGVAEWADERWRAPVGRRGWGLQALSVGFVSGEGWAVGEQDRIARRTAGQWSLYRPEQRTIEVELRAVSAPLWPRNAWAVGEHGGHAAFRVGVQDESGDTVWVDVPAGADELPPVTDVYADGPGGIAVGAWSTTVGAVLSLRSGAWHEIARLAGEPREVIMGASTTAPDGSETLFHEGWIFGTVSTAGGEAAAVWELDGRSNQWLEQIDLRQPGRALVDAYQQALPIGQSEVYLGTTPRGGEPLVRYLRVGEAHSEWQPLTDSVPNNLDQSTGDTRSRALAPTRDGGLIYAWGDGIWRWHRQTDEWTMSRPRLDLAAVAPLGAGAWALTRDGRQLVRIGATGWSVSPGIELVDVSSAGDGLWAISAAGHVMRLSGPLSRAHTHAALVSGTLHALSAVDAHNAWAAGTSSAGWPALYSFSTDQWRQEAAIDLGALHGGTFSSVALGTQGVWAAGSIAAIDASEAITLPGRAVFLPADCPVPGRNCALQFGFALPMVEVAAADSSAWLAGGHVLYRCSPDSRGAHRLAPAHGAPEASLLGCTFEATAPSGGHFVAVAAAADDDAWAVALEGPTGRERSIVMHRNAHGWSRACEIDVPIHAAHVSTAEDGRRTLWLAGEWTTLIRHTYAPDPSLAPACS
jgi:hypothetical protein